MSALTIADITVRQDAEGRYCLNDLHKAAGGHVNHQPNFFMKRNESALLLAELNSDNSLNYEAAVSKAGRNGGTFVVKELVYAYAMWISPAFNLKIIRAFDELQTNGVAFSDRAVSQVASGELEEAELVPEYRCANLHITCEDGYFNMTKAAKAFGKDVREFFKLRTTDECVEALSDLMRGIPIIKVQRGSGLLPHVGTWGHPKLAVFFARWLDPKFAVFCDMVIDNILNKKAELTITQPKQPMKTQVLQSFVPRRWDWLLN